jgi:trehalose 6-phosphate synthase
MAAATSAAEAVPRNLSGAAIKRGTLGMVANMAPLVVVSNRGPLAFARADDGKLTARRGGGGLAATFGPALAEHDAVWVSAAITDEDREAVEHGLTEADGFRWRALILDNEEYRMFYDVVSNATLWFMHHGLFDLPRRPRIDRKWRDAWHAYRDVNNAFADAVCEEADEGATVLVHDYHLALMGARLAVARPDLRTAHFNHTPFSPPAGLRVLPADVAHELLSGLAGFGACGFHSRRWAECFEACAEEFLGGAPPTFVAPAATDHDSIAKVAAGDECARELALLDEQVGDRHLIVRVDRIELSKNLLRGFLAFDDLLQTRPEWRGRVVFGAFVYPSRESLPEYLAYHQEVEALARRINETWATDEWTPIILDDADFFPRSCAALRRYDVLLINPVRDGLNLVAKEGALLNERNGVIALSRETGVWEELHEGALDVNPFDVAGTADVLAEALVMEHGERMQRADILRRASDKRTPHDWLADQVRAARTR